MTPSRASFALALIAECSRNGTSPDPALLWWLVDSVGLAVRDGISVDQALGIRSGSKSIIRSARLLSRNACLAQARSLVDGSDRQASVLMAGRVAHLKSGGCIESELDGLVALAIERGCPESAETIRKVLRRECGE